MKSSFVVWAFLMLVFCPFSAIQARSLEEINRTGEIRVGISPIHPSICSATIRGCRSRIRAFLRLTRSESG